MGIYGNYTEDQYKSLNLQCGREQQSRGRSIKKNKSSRDKRRRMRLERKRRIFKNRERDMRCRNRREAIDAEYQTRLMLVAFWSFFGFFSLVIAIGVLYLNSK